MSANTAYAKALASSFASDMDNPFIAKAIMSRGLTKRQFTQIVNRDIAKGLAGDPGPALFPNLRAFARQAVDIAAIKRANLTSGAILEGLSAALPPSTTSTMSTIGGISSLVGGLAAAVGAIWGAKITTDAQKSIAKIQLQEAQIVQNSQSIAAKSALIQNATANGLRANADGQPIDPSTGTPLSEIGQAAQAKVAGVPAWGIAAGAAAAVVGGYFAFGGH
jgi:hypothetical protein